MLKSRMRIRVEWSHCDPARIIFNPHYYIWMDQGTHQLLTAAGFDFANEAATEKFRGCPLVESGAQFVEPAFLGDVVTLSSWVDRLGNSSFTVKHTFKRNGQLLAKGQEIRVWAIPHPDDASRMKSTRIPDGLRDALQTEGSVDSSV